MVNAWQWGVRFFAGRWLLHALILIGVGLLLPLALRLLMVGDFAMISPVAAPGGELAPAGTIAMAIGYILQLGSFFASLRLGLGHGETLGRALLFGMIAGLLVAFVFGLLLILIGAALGSVATPLAALFVLLWFMAVLATVWTTLAALLGVGLCLGLALAMAFGTATGNLGFAATMVGGSGFVVVLLIVLAGVMLWMAARLSCATVLMAERRSFNLGAAMRDSWSLTWDDEWRIFRYLALLGLIVALLMFGAAAAAGAAFSAAFGGAASPAVGIGGAILQMGIAIPLVLLTVLVPAGIHRELVGAPAAASADVFA